jgi:opacity protein-like surface antigen
MKALSLLLGVALLASSSAALAGQAPVCADQLEKNWIERFVATYGQYGLQVDDIAYSETVSTGDQAAEYGVTCTFKSGGHLWHIVDNYMSGTGVNYAVTDDQCNILDSCQTYAE